MVLLIEVTKLPSPLSVLAHAAAAIWMKTIRRETRSLDLESITQLSGRKKGMKLTFIAYEWFPSPNHKSSEYPQHYMNNWMGFSSSLWVRKCSHGGLTQFLFPATSTLIILTAWYGLFDCQAKQLESTGALIEESSTRVCYLMALALFSYLRGLGPLLGVKSLSSFTSIGVAIPKKSGKDECRLMVLVYRT